MTAIETMIYAMAPVETITPASVPQTDKVASGIVTGNSPYVSKAFAGIRPTILLQYLQAGFLA